MATKTSRRNFLRTVPIAAAAGLTLTDTLLAAAQDAAASGASVAAAAQPFKLFGAKELASDIAALDATPGDNRLYDSKTIPVQIVLSTEVHKSATEFEWHEDHDHIVQILDGTTLYEVGGTPTGIKSMGPGEWHATGSTGSRSVLMGKGDILVIPRGTLHKRSTEDSVTFLLTSNSPPAKA